MLLEKHCKIEPDVEGCGGDGGKDRKPACVPGDCDDGDPCTIDECDPATGCFHIPDADDPVCYGPESGSCESDADCDDNDPCTEDYCDPATGCGHEAVSGCASWFS